MSSGNDTISIGSVVNNGGLNNTGKIEIAGDQVFNAGGLPAVTPAAVFSAIAEAVPEEARAEIQEQVIAPLEQELEQLKALPPAEQEAAKEDALARAAAMLEPLKPYAEGMAKIAIKFTEPLLAAVAPPVGWFLAGTISVLKSFSKQAS